MKSSVRIVLIACAIVLCALSPGFAQESGHEEHGGTSTQETREKQGETAENGEHNEAEGHGGRHYHMNDVGIFLGATDEHGHDTEFTWGLEYRRMISKRWAIGGFFDHAGGELRNAILAPSVTWLPVGRLQITAAPGIEFHRGRGSTEGCGCEPHTKSEDPEQIGLVDEDETYFVFRLGAGWNFPVGQNYAITPQINLDLVEGERVWVYGLVFAYAW